MREMGWTWRELMETPAVVVEAIWRFLAEEAAHREREARRWELRLRDGR